MTPEGTVIREGSTDILVPLEHSVHGPGKKVGSVFFNEQMAFNRDVSVMLLRSLERESITVADAMCATGSRSVRIANEVPGSEVTANDISPSAMPYIQANIELNGLTNCRANCSNLHILFTEESFDYVDLDPFGSPMPFLSLRIPHALPPVRRARDGKEGDNGDHRHRHRAARRSPRTQVQA